MDQETFSKRFDSFKARLSGSQPPIADLDAQPGRFEMPVVVLVHGIGGEASHWSNPAALDVTSTWLFNTKAEPAGSGKLLDISLSPAYKPAEVRSWCKVLSNEGISYVNYSQPPGKLLAETASELAQLLKAVEEIIYDPPAPNDRQPPLIMLCHSRGGLVTRLALNTLGKQALPHLTRVITLCTPHEGSYMPLLAKNVSDGQVDFSKLSDTLLGRVLAFGLKEEDAEIVLSDLGQLVKKYLSGAFGAAGMGTDFDELIPTNALFTCSLSVDEPLPGVSYHGFSGVNPAIVAAYVKVGPLHHRLLTISSLQIMTYLREILPGFSSTYKGLAELDTGDSSVAPASSHWPDRFKANHYCFPVNHLEALIDQNLQNAVIDLLEGKDFTKLVEEAAAKGKASSEWLNDPTVSAIHDAFLLGWTTIELKSRVQLATRDQLIFSESSAWNGDRSALAHDDSKILGWLETEAQRMSGLSTPGKPVKPDFNSNLVIPKFVKTDSMQLTSLSRSLFSRIAALHFKHFPINNTADTAYAYNPKDSGKDWSFLNNVPQEITSFGVRSLGPVKDDKGMERTPLADFGLYELTRQALNCLALLFTVSSESLIGTTIAEYQRRLVFAINPRVDGPDTHPFSTDEWNCAIQKLGELIVDLLEAWDGYLREQYFIGGEFKDDEIELVAYEAGRSMATISWCTSVRVEPLERLLQGLQDKTTQKQVLCYLKYLKQREAFPEWKRQLEQEIEKALQGFKPQDVNADETTFPEWKRQLESAIEQALQDFKPQEIKPQDIKPQDVNADETTFPEWKRQLESAIEQALQDFKPQDVNAGEATFQEWKKQLEQEIKKAFGETTIQEWKRQLEQEIKKALQDFKPQAVNADETIFQKWKEQLEPKIEQALQDFKPQDVKPQDDNADETIFQKWKRQLEPKIEQALQDFKSQDVNADETIFQKWKKQLNQEIKKRLRETTIQKWKRQLEQEIKKAWKHIFDRRDIIRLQHQITMLSTNMDEAFYRLNPYIKKPATDVRAAES